MACRWIYSPWTGFNFFSSEDSVKHVLKNKLLNHNADTNHILFLDLKDEQFQEVTFNSLFLRILKWDSVMP